jgi:alkanesulfonate monooxygenase SsuD/methylene tetrahydromethanopterin reductase-like flavin-dependent oxidoreductase (luciferase family)
MELGFYTFGDRVADPETGIKISAKERLDQMMEMAMIADQAGLDIIGVGEHHQLNYVNSATATIIAAMAAVTKHIRFTSASTSISTADPVRTFQEFATADLVSNGRVEIVFGRGAFTDNFPLFGFDLKDYDSLFIEKIKLFDLLNSNERVTWKGRFRSELVNAEIAPRPVQKKLPVWIGAGSPDSVARAATMGYPLAIPVLGGSIPGYARLAKYYKEVWMQSGHAMSDFQLAVFSHLQVTDGSVSALDQFYRYYSAYLEPLFKGPMPKEQFQQMTSPMGSLVSGGTREVIDKILLLKEMGVSRYVGQIDIGGQPWHKVIKSIELFASKVAPEIRKHSK